MAEGARSIRIVLPRGWRPWLARAVARADLRRLEAFLEAERRRYVVYPPQREVLSALRLTPYRRVRVVLLGQDPYPGQGQAHGLAFSVRPGVPIPPSLQNIFRELADDVGCRPPTHGCLEAWARQGVLLLNTVLTVRAGQPGSHRGRGWEAVVDAVLRTVSAKPDAVVFVLWGSEAGRKRELIDRRHPVITGAHPSPQSAARGFFGSRPFSRVNALLCAAGKPPIDWQIPDR